MQELDHLINPPLIGIHPDNMVYRGPLPAVGAICYAWPQFPFKLPANRYMYAKLPIWLRHLLWRI